MEFAARLGITQPAFNQFLNGATPISNAMILKISSELSVDPKKLVKGIRFFEPFFDYIVTTRVVRIRYSIGAKTTRTKAVTGEAIHYHVHSNTDLDMYAVEINDKTYEPRYYKNEKVIVVAIPPEAGDEAFVMWQSGAASIVRFTDSDTFESLKNVGRLNPGLVSLSEKSSEIEYVHKIVGSCR